MSKESAIRQLKHVRMICCGDYHSACLVEPGSVYTWGRGQVLGRESHDPPTAPSQARRGSLASVTSQDGYGDGSVLRSTRARSASVQMQQGLEEADSSQPEVVAFFSRRRVQHICAGEGHLMARSGADIFAWGDNKHGQVRVYRFDLAKGRLLIAHLMGYCRFLSSLVTAPRRTALRQWAC
jgi:hypothetical protein